MVRVLVIQGGVVSGTGCGYSSERRMQAREGIGSDQE